MTSLSQSPRDRILWILTEHGGKMERSRLRRRMAMRKDYTDEEKFRIELLHKNFDCIMSAYSSAEDVFPYWEAAYAIIIGQLFIAYFGNISLGGNALQLLAILGSVLSLSWLILVSLNLQHANRLNDTLIDYGNFLDNAYKHYQVKIESIGFTSPFRYKQPRISDLIIGKNEKECFRQALKKMPRSTWFYRRLLPFVLTFIWIYLLCKPIR